MPETLDFCGCCEGIERETPVSVENRPGLSALAYRVGTHGRFKASMQAALADQAALAGLTTRADDDPSMALIDAWATVLDVLSFYQERIANEGYLRTATERRSVLELARRIGYELSPGVAASTVLAFTLQTGPGAPEAATVPEGTQAQSIPGQDEVPQTFETVEAIEARAEWQAMPARQRAPAALGDGTTGLWLEGVDNNLSPGDGVLFVGADRDAFSGDERWDFRRLTAVELDRDRGLTWVEFSPDLGSEFTQPAADPTVYVLRQRAALFGYNAPDWRTMPQEVKESYCGTRDKNGDPDCTEWPDFSISDIADAEQTIYLDAIYPEIGLESWIVLARPGEVELYQVDKVAEDARADFTLSAKTTRLVLKGERLDEFDNAIRETVVFCVSEALVRAEAPIETPVFGNEVVLGGYVERLEEGRLLAISGAPVRQVRVAEDVGELALTDADGVPLTTTLQPNDVLEVVAPPERQDDGLEQWHIVTSDDTEALVLVEPEILLPEPEDDAALVSEVVELALADEVDGLSRFTFTANLTNVYHRETVILNANVAAATHGKTIADEVLGSGDGSASFQTFTLAQLPLTYVSAATASGVESTLEVRVDGVRWDEVSSLYGQSPDARVYITRLADDGTVTVQFGDGLSGARLPTGIENVTASYRYGLGLEGLVDDEQISLLMTRPLGVKGVANPTAPTGADDPEPLADARGNAPLTVLTLDRIVSVQDFEDFAAAFAGIGKAQATVLWSGERRLVHLTVAGAEGAEVTDDSALYTNLLDAIDAARYPEEDVVVASYDGLTFTVEAVVIVDEAYMAEDVAAAVEAALLDAFSFEARAFGQAVTTSEVLAVMQAVEGVVAVDLDALDGNDPFASPRLPARIARWEGGTIQPAELLTIDPDDPDSILLTTAAP